MNESIAARDRLTGQGGPMIEYRGIHRVSVGETPCELHVWQKSKTVWVAMGEYMDEWLGGQGRSESAAIKDWRDRADRKTQESEVVSDDDLGFKVVKDRGAHDELLALTANLPIGQGAFGAAARLYANETVELREGTRVVLSSIHEIGNPMDSAPRSGERILIDAELQSDRMENAINEWVFARWDAKAKWWRLSPHAKGTKIDSVNGWLPTSFLPSRRR